MTSNPDRIHMLLGSSEIGKPAEPPKHAGPATILSGLPRTIRRHELHMIVPLADTTIYEMEIRGEFPRRYYLTSRCVVWDLGEVEAWLRQRRKDSDAGRIKKAPSPDVRLRKTRPIKEH
ncbi:helix-turn-helix transcriptional regulator [Xanthobacter autotrophicus]